MKKIIFIWLAIILLVSSAYADTVWVLCQPDSYVNIRQFPSKKHQASGRMECGWDAETNGKSQNGYLYLSSVGTEDGCGWINKGYIIYSEPIVKTFDTNIYSKGRVACWRSIGGKRRCWIKPGAVITVYAVSEEWSITNKGFVRTKYLGVDYDVLYTQLEGQQTDIEPAGLY